MHTIWTRIFPIGHYFPYSCFLIISAEIFTSPCLPRASSSFLRSCKHSAYALCFTFSSQIPPQIFWHSFFNWHHITRLFVSFQLLKQSFLIAFKQSVLSQYCVVLLTTPPFCCLDGHPLLEFFYYNNNCFGDRSARYSGTSI